MAQEKMKLSVDTGSVLIDIDDRGEIFGQFRFNPSDFDIIRRYEQVVKKLEDVANMLSDNDNPTEDDIFAASDEVKKQFDYLLNYNVADQIFAKANPFTPLANGDLYCENVLNGIASLIEDTMNKRINNKMKKIQSATAKYHK